MSRHTKITLLFSFAALYFGCGPAIEPIDLHDPVVPIESRRLVADAQDAVSIGRARRDSATLELKATRDWREEMLENRKWPGGANSAKNKLEELADARVKLAELQLQRAEKNLEFAEAKYDLVTAKVAIRHDLAVYELDPLEKRADSLRKDLEALSRQIENQFDRVDKITKNWWSAYSSFAKGGGKTQVFYVAAEAEPKIKPRKKKKKKISKEEKDTSKAGEDILSKSKKSDAKKDDKKDDKKNEDKE